MAGTFEIYKSKNGEYRWRLKASNGEPVAQGEGYSSHAAAVKGTESVQRAAEGAAVKDVDA